jgi:hypothetical protein
MVVCIGIFFWLHKYLEHDAFMNYLVVYVLVVLVEVWFISLVWSAFKELESLEKNGRVEDCSKA